MLDSFKERVFRGRSNGQMDSRKRESHWYGLGVAFIEATTDLNFFRLLSLTSLLLSSRKIGFQSSIGIFLWYDRKNGAMVRTLAALDERQPLGALGSNLAWVMNLVVWFHTSAAFVGLSLSPINMMKVKLKHSLIDSNKNEETADLLRFIMKWIGDLTSYKVMT